MSTDQPDYDAAAQTLTASETIEDTVTVNGSEVPVKTEVPTLAELNELDEAMGDADDEEELIKSAVDDYLVEPDVDPTAIPVNKLTQFFYGLQEIWSGSQEVEAAMADMPLEGQGNR